MRTLLLRHQELATDRPELDENGVLRRGAAWVALPPVEARLFSALLERMGRVTTRSDLNHAGWPAEAPDRNVLDVHILHLRRKTAALGLAIRTIRSRGYLLEAVGLPPRAPTNGHAAEAVNGANAVS
jgi:DNA-binding response OmpR family regulator